MKIVKASGEREVFSKDKLCRSLLRSGVKPILAKKVCWNVAKTIAENASSRDVLNIATGLLKKENRLFAARYNLKRAIMELGPTGFPFEEYIGEILRAYGYQIKVDQIINGFCVKHEVDVVAEKGTERFYIEAKYHNRRGVVSDVKVTLYIHSRFLDIKKWVEASDSANGHTLRSWLITNTRWTADAIHYAQCSGLKLSGWRHPSDGGLEKMIEQKGLYPITMLPSLNRRAKDTLYKKKIMMAGNILNYSLDDFVKFSGIYGKLASMLYFEAKNIRLF